MEHTKKHGNPWPGHPFNRLNNINHIDGDTNGEGEEVHTLNLPAVTRIQESYVHKVIETVNDLDNVLYEIANESSGSKQWQFHFVRYVRQVEKLMSKRHPVGMTVGWPAVAVDNTALFAGPADWISLNSDGGYKTDPPAASGQKVILTDTDHLWGEGGGQQWVWESFCRGLNPIYMDRVATLTRERAGDIPEASAARRAMGNTRRLAERMNLVAVVPRPDLVSSRYCLAEPGREFVIYLPDGGKVTVDLTDEQGAFLVEWMHPVAETSLSQGTVSGGSKRSFEAPFSGDAVLHLHKRH